MFQYWHNLWYDETTFVMTILVIVAIAIGMYLTHMSGLATYYKDRLTEVMTSNAQLRYELIQLKAVLDDCQRTDSSTNTNAT